MRKLFPWNGRRLSANMPTNTVDLWAIPVKKPVPPVVSTRERLSDVKGRVLAVFQEYCNISTLHGLRNVADLKTPLYERLSWLGVVVVCFGLTISTTWSVWQRYLYTPTITTIESNHYPIYKIPFPTVTICNTNVVLRSSALTVIEKFETLGLKPSVSERFLKNLPQAFKANRPVRIHDWNKLSDAMKAFNYTISSLMFELSQPCSRLLHQCFWRGDAYNCSDMFVPIATSEGYCCSFNWHGKSLVLDGGGLHIRRGITSNSTNWRKRGDFTKKLYVSDAGTSAAGLTVIVNTEIENYFASINSFLGAAVLVHDPERYPDVTTMRVFIQPRYETNVRVSARVVESADNVRTLDVEQRQCRFDNEMSLQTSKTYSYESCVLDCKMKAYLAQCNCIPFFYPKYGNDSTTRCDLFHWPCLFENRDIFASQDFRRSIDNDSDQLGCECLPSCTDISYEFEAYGNNIFSNQHASLDFQGNLGNKTLFSVYFQDNVCIKYRRSSQMNFEAILASFGGILGLYLGGSVVSVIELFYYLLIKTWKKRVDDTHGMLNIHSTYRVRF